MTSGNDHLRFKLPPINEYIPSNFELKTQKLTANRRHALEISLPSKIKSQSWWKFQTEFKVPQIFAAVKFSLGTSSLEKEALVQLLAATAKETLEQKFS